VARRRRRATGGRFACRLTTVAWSGSLTEITTLEFLDDSREGTPPADDPAGGGGRGRITPMPCTLLMNLYGTRVRCAELAHRKASDIGSKSRINSRLSWACLQQRRCGSIRLGNFRILT
jgi:hypothetical protein